MTTTISRSDYYTEVQSIANEIREEHLTEGPGFEPYDRIHEMVDGHQYVIYTHLARQVLEHSDNDCAIFDEFGPQSWEDWGTAFSQSACVAMMRDVQEALDELGEVTWECSECGSDLDERWDDLDARMCDSCKEEHEHEDESEEA